MCYRPQPNLKRRAPRKSATAEADRRSRDSEAQLAQLRGGQVRAPNGWLGLLRATGRLLLGFAAAIVSA